MTYRIALAAAAALLVAAGAAEARSSGGFHGGGRSSLTTGQITTNGTIIGQKVVVADGFGSRSIVIAPVPTQQALQNQFFGPAAGGVIATTGNAFFVPGASTVTRFNNTGFVGEVVPVATIDGRLGSSTAFGGGTLLDGWGGWGSYRPVVINLPSGPTLVAAPQAVAPPPPPAKTQVVRIGATAAESRVLTAEKGVLFLQGR
jgi:hypothetical protein